MKLPKENNMRLQMARYQRGTGREVEVEMTFLCKSSQNTVFVARLPLGELAKGIAGYFEQECAGDLNAYGVKHFGMKKISRVLEVPMPKCAYKDRKQVAYNEACKHAPEGWEVCHYFNSQSSFFYKGSVEYLRASLHKFVEQNQEKEKTK